MAVFVSYSRKDQSHVHRLCDALIARQRETWVDWQGIPPSADWMREIEAAIDAAEAVVFALSPDSLASQVCATELAHALAQNKRILPIVVRDVAQAPVPAALARLNWIFLRDSDEPDAAIARLLQAIDTDLDWVQAHTRLLVRAREWEARALDSSLLLNGADLSVAERWLELGPDKSPPPTAAQTRFIIESRRQATRRRFQWMTGVAVALVAVGVLGTLSVLERQQAAHQEAIAVARRLAAAAERLREQPPAAHGITPPLERSLQLAAEAVRRLAAIGEHSLDADLALRRALAISAQPVRSFGKGGDISWLEALTFTGDGELVAAGASPVKTFRWRLLDGALVTAGSTDYSRSRLRLSSDGGWLASLHDPGRSGERAIELRNAHNAEMLARHDRLPDVVEMAVGPGGLLAASVSDGGQRGETRLWLGITPEPVVRLPFAYSPGFSPDGRYLAGIVDGRVNVWSVASLLGGAAAALQVFDAPAASGLGFSPDSSHLLVRYGDEPEHLRAWTLPPDGGQSVLETTRDGFLAAGPTARLLLLGNSRNPVLSVVDSRHGNTIARIVGAGEHTAWSVDGSLAVITDTGVDVWRPLPQGSAAVGIDAGTDAVGFAFDADERRATLLHRRGSGAAQRLVASRWDVATGRRLGEVDFGVASRATTFSADGSRIAFAAEGELRVVDSASGRVLHRWPSGGKPAALALSGDGRFAAVLDEAGTLSALQVEPPRLVAQARAAASAGTEQLSIGADGGEVVAVNFEGQTRAGAALSVRRWRTSAMAQPDSRRVARMQNGSFAAVVCALSGNGERIAVAAPGVALRVRDSRTGADLALVDEAGPDALCAFNADASLLAVTGGDATLRIWNVAAREEVARLDLFVELRSIAFSASGRSVAALDQQGLLRSWPIDASDLLAQACSRLRSNMTPSDWSRFVPAEAYRATCDKLPVAAEEQQ